MATLETGPSSPLRFPPPATIPQLSQKKHKEDDKISKKIDNLEARMGKLEDLLQSINTKMELLLRTMSGQQSTPQFAGKGVSKFLE